MKIRRAALLVACTVASACGGALPAPVIESVTPASITQGQAPIVLIAADAVFPSHIDYGARAAEFDAQVTVQIGPVPLLSPVVTPTGDVSGLLPLALGVGTHDVTLTLADGRSATLPGAFEVKPGAFPDGFTIDPIPDQQRNVPFPLTIRAVGGAAAEFTGGVELSVNRGSISPTVTGPFSGGIRTEPVTVSAPGADTVITVRDAQGHTASSNPFRVVN